MAVGILDQRRPLPTPSPSPPSLPLELWVQIIGSITDSRYLPRVWLNFRRVSRTFKEATEMAFISTHLRHAELSFRECQASVHDLQANLVYPHVILRFDRLARDDRGRAVFTRRQPAESLKQVRVVGAGPDDNLFDLSIRRWRASLEPYATAAASPEKPYARPPHALSVRRIVNDTALPGLEVDFEKHEVSVQWAPMLSLLFGEEEYKKWAKKIDYQHSSVRESRQHMMDMVLSGDMGYEEYEDVWWDYTKRRDKRVHEAVRHARLKRYGHDCVVNRDDLWKCHALDAVRRYKQFEILPDEWEHQGPEECQGNFYDGLGLEFQGNRETNSPGETELYPE